VCVRFSVERRGVTAWKIAYERSRRQLAVKLSSVSSRGNRAVIRFYWVRWLDYYSDKLIDRDVQLRADRAWAKVQGWL
jgi:hypothetical protein